MAGKMAEDAKIAVRNIRQDYMKKIDTAEKAKEISEDISKAKKAELQKDIDTSIKTMEDMFDHKEADIMKL
jgi:ribosome recycling factor